MEVFEITPNGHETVDQAIDAVYAPPVILPASAMRRLAVLRDVAKGAAEAAQAAVDIANARQAALNDALTAACEDQGVNIPADQQRAVDLDWSTGRLSFKP